MLSIHPRENEKERQVTHPPATAIACANIALAKYWGKQAGRENLTAVPSLSLTLDALKTETTVTFVSSLKEDEATLDGHVVSARPLMRIRDMLDRVREQSQTRAFAKVTSVNHFPTAAGLASSASGFAALALAATKAAGLSLTPGELSALARRSSASAARSLFAGYAELLRGTEEATAVAPPEHLPVEMIIAITESGPKSIGSTEAMNLTAQTSPLYGAWVDSAEGMFRKAKACLLEKDLSGLGVAMEQSTLAMHATMQAASPAVLYFSPATVRVVHWLRRVRAERGYQAFFTMDAGPHVKVLCHSGQAEALALALADVEGVTRVLRSAPGPAARVVPAESQES